MNKPLVTEAEDLAVVSEETVEEIAELKYVRSQMSQLRQREVELRDSILATIAGHTVAITETGMPVAHVETQSRSKVSSDKLRAKFPEVYDEVTSESNISILKIDL